MKCPYCEYEDVTIVSYTETIYHGDFYTLTNDIEAYRYTPKTWETDSIRVFGCPSCFKVFISK
jgi:hypothetical protein